MGEAGTPRALCLAGDDKSWNPQPHSASKKVSVSLSEPQGSPIQFINKVGVEEDESRNESENNSLSSVREFVTFAFHLSQSVSGK